MPQWKLRALRECVGGDLAKLNNQNNTARIYQHTSRHVTRDFQWEHIGNQEWWGKGSGYDLALKHRSWRHGLNTALYNCLYYTMSYTGNVSIVFTCFLKIIVQFHKIQELNI